MEEGAFTVSEPFAPAPAIPSWKRALDLLCILVASPLLLPVMALISVFIKIISPGPVLFKQERIGFLGRSFNCLKFRTMQVDASVASHENYFKKLIQSEAPMTKKDILGDPRLFPLASALRASGMDELPQVINILRGEMSLVGPRPCLRYEYEDYLPWQKRRFNTLPGITGLWQVSGKNRTTFSKMIDLDISYVANRCLWLDLKIMLKTVPVLALQCFELLQKRLRKLLSR